MMLEMRERFGKFTYTGSLQPLSLLPWNQYVAFPPSRPTLTAWGAVGKSLTSLCLSFPVSEMGAVLTLGLLEEYTELVCVLGAYGKPVSDSHCCWVAATVFGLIPRLAHLLHSFGHCPRWR